jgi:pilus assembly protein Flp/PilA
MSNLIAKFHLAIMNLRDEEGQDLVEYALLIALIAFSCTAGMHALASDINVVFKSLGSGVASY